MNRRSFLKGVAASSSLAMFGGVRGFAATTAPEFSITMDDPRIDSVNGIRAVQINNRILKHLADAKAKAVLFVCGMRVDNTEGGKLLAAWNDAGHLLGNHSYSHQYFHSAKVTLAGFETDVAKGEQVIEAYPQHRRIFRFPFLKEGNTAEKRDGMRKWLTNSGYSRGAVTIDASDWAIDARMVKKLKEKPKTNVSAYRDFYLAHIWERAEYYDQLAQKVLGASPKHTLLIHHNLLNALFLGDVLKMLKQKGWKLIDAEDAYKDPVYKREPQILPAGESLIWALAKETGQYEKLLRYPGEDSVYEDPKMDKLKL